MITTNINYKDLHEVLELFFSKNLDPNPDTEIQTWMLADLEDWYPDNRLRAKLVEEEIFVALQLLSPTHLESIIFFHNSDDLTAEQALADNYVLSQTDLDFDSWKLEQFKEAYEKLAYLLEKYL